MTSLPLPPGYLRLLLRAMAKALVFLLLSSSWLLFDEPLLFWVVTSSLAFITLIFTVDLSFSWFLWRDERRYLLTEVLTPGFLISIIFSRGRDACDE